ncbi:MAG: SEC-C metal-binding domain-containing protein [Casimicrobium sp.]
MITNATMTPPKSRNATCPCGSGKRYKACHGATAPASNAQAAEETLASLMQAALRAQVAGDLDAAEALYRQALTLDPNQADCLHMLGVVRMQRFDLLGARELIERAGELVEWSHTSFRHNYAHLLSSFLSAREPTNLPERLREMQDQRRAREPLAPSYGVVIVNPLATANTLSETLASLASLAVAPSAVVVLGGGVNVGNDAWPFAVHSTAWRGAGERASDDLTVALALVRQPYVAIMHAGDTAQEALPMALKSLVAGVAHWGVARAVASDAQSDNLTLSARENMFTLLQHSPRVGAALFAEGIPLSSVCNLLWHTPFLLARLAERPASFRALCEMAMWEEEPLFLDHVMVRFAASYPASSAFWDEESVLATLDVGFLAKALSGVRAPNPVAPSIEFDGPSFLKRALRIGLGRRLGPASLRAVAQQVVAAPTASAALDPNGVELIGFARAENGLGESLRLLAHSCQIANVPVGITNVPLDMGMRQNDRSIDALLVNAPTYRTRVICTNPDMLGEGNFVDGAFALPDAYNVGYWYWELENLPARWPDVGQLIDELWVATDFVADAARKVLDKPVFKVTPPIDMRVPSRRYTRAEFGLPDDAFVFMFSFDFNSYPARKNPSAIVRAFKLAFASAERGVRLLIKCHGASGFVAEREALLRAINGDDRITLLDQTLSRDAVVGLQTVIDCYVSLHRSEGLGLGLAECMALGKPVIGTAYSGNLEFMREHNSLLVDYTMVPVKEGEYLDWQNQHWAEASVVHAAEHMRRLFEDRAFARALGLAGQRTIHEEYSRDKVGQRIRVQLDRINSTLANNPRANGNAMHRLLARQQP